jgi:hypothetical protein
MYDGWTASSLHMFCRKFCKIHCIHEAVLSSMLNTLQSIAIPSRKTFLVTENQRIVFLGPCIIRRPQRHPSPSAGWPLQQAL